MNPEKNEFETLTELEITCNRELQDRENQLADLIKSKLVRPNGEPVPEHWSVFTVDELYEINGYTFRCKYIGKTSILFEPVSPIDALDK